LAQTNKIAAIAKRQKVLESIAVNARGMPHKEALNYLNKISRELITETERNGLISQRNRQNEIETATTNRKVRWDTLRKLTKNPESVTDDYLESLVKPDSLTWDDAEEFKKIRDTENHPLKSSGYHLYSNILNELYRDVTKPVKEVEYDRTLEYDRKFNELKHFFETSPDAVSPEKRRKFFEGLSAEPKRDFLEKLWDWNVGWRLKLLKQPYEIWKRRKAKTEKPGMKSLLSPTIEFDKVWPSLEEKQKENIWKALNNGYTPQEILESLEIK